MGILQSLQRQETHGSTVRSFVSRRTVGKTRIFSEVEIYLNFFSAAPIYLLIFAFYSGMNFRCSMDPLDGQ